MLKSGMRLKVNSRVGAVYQRLIPCLLPPVVANKLARMNTHHKKSTYRPPPPRNPQHFSSSTLQLPLTRSESSHSAQQLFKAIERVPFGWQVSLGSPRSARRRWEADNEAKLDVVLPEIAAANPSTLIDSLKRGMEQGAQYQLVQGVNLADLLEPTFLNSFVRKGERALSKLFSIVKSDTHVGSWLQAV